MFEGGLTPPPPPPLFSMAYCQCGNSKTFLIYCKTSLNSFMRSKLNELLLMYF